MAENPAAERARATYAWTREAPPDLCDCPHPWDRLDVTASGEALACCFAQESLGNVITLGLDAVLDGPRRARLQGDVAANRINPTCLEAPCIYAHASTRRPWTVHFPADRFSHSGDPADEAVGYDPKSGDGLLAAGPWRYLPAARVDARVLLARPGLILPFSSTGSVRVEVVDEAGTRYVQAHRRLGWRRDQGLQLHFSLPKRRRLRMGVRIWLTGVNGPLRFGGLVLQGEPV